jgi:chromosome segregation ATPase
MNDEAEKNFNPDEMNRDEGHMPKEGTPRWVWLAVIVLAGVSIVGLAVGWNATTHARNAEKALVFQNKAFEQNVNTLSQRLAQAEETNAQLQNDFSAVMDRLKTTQGQITTAERQTRRIGDEYSKKLGNVQSELARKASADDVQTLGGDVNGVKSDLEATKSNLSVARDEFGTLIARNHDEIDQLRRLGERDYFEFSLTGKGNRSKVGQLMVELRGTNAKKNQFTVALYVDDLRLEKKNRSVDEPIYFYTRGTRAPLELVINEVSRDKVAGYLSVPKGQTTTAATKVTN